MAVGHTTALVQRCLDELGERTGEESVALAARDLLGNAAQRLHVLCESMLRRSYPRLTRPPVGLDGEEMLGAVVERLLKALRVVRPTNVRQFFALANQHMRWELNELARRLADRSAPVDVSVELLAAPSASQSSVGVQFSRVLAAIDALDAETREVFDLVRVQGLTHSEAAELLAVSTKTIQRRLQRGLVELSAALGDLRRAPSQ